MEGMATHPSIYVIHTYLTHGGYGNISQYIYHTHIFNTSRVWQHMPVYKPKEPVWDRFLSRRGTTIQ